MSNTLLLLTASVLLTFLGGVSLGLGRGSSLEEE